jgi:hypothetical protein
VRQTCQTNRIHAGFWQDQIDIGKVKLNVGGRFDDFDRDRYRTFTEGPTDAPAFKHVITRHIPIVPELSLRLWSMAFGRLKEGVDREAAREELKIINGRLEAAYPETNRGVYPTARTHSEFFIGAHALAIYGPYSLSRPDGFSKEDSFNFPIPPRSPI